MLRVLHLVGSPTDEFMADLSRLYAADCLQAVEDPERYAATIAYVSPDGCWRFPPDLSREALSAAAPMSVGDAVGHLAGLGIDVAVPQMFCRAGMTSYRALLDVLGIPYVGNPADVMALGAHKARARAVVAAAGVRVPAGELLRHGDRPSLSLPVVVKPVDVDNSVGLSLVREPTELDAALMAAFEHADEVLVEAYVELGREVRCGVLEQGGELVCLPLEEYAVDPVTKPVRDAADKLARGADGDLRLVAKDTAHAWVVDVQDPVTEAVWELARTSHRALGCRHYSLFDVRVDPDGQPWFLEAGLYCSFAEQSVVSTMARAAGVGLPELFASVVGEALSGGQPSLSRKPASRSSGASQSAASADR